MKKEGIRIPSIAAKVFVFSFLGAGACACLVLTVLYALWGEFVTAAFTVVGMVVFIAGIRFEKRMGDDHYRLDEAGIQIVRDRKTTDFITWKDMTGVVIRHAPYKGQNWMYFEFRMRKLEDGVCVEDKRVSIPSPILRSKRALILNQISRHELNEEA